MVLVTLAILGCMLAAWLGFIMVSGNNSTSASRDASDVETTERQDAEASSDPNAGSTTTPNQTEPSTAPEPSSSSAGGEPAAAPQPQRDLTELRTKAQQAVAEAGKLASDLQHPALQQLFGSLQVDLDDAQSFEDSGNTDRAAANYESVVERAARLADSKTRLPDLKTATTAYTEALREANSLNSIKYERDAFLEASKARDTAAEAIEKADFATAIESFNAGTETLKTVVAAQRQRIVGFRETGAKAMEEGDKAVAVKAFTDILDVDRNDADARFMLGRAQTIDILVQSLRKAQALEDRREFALAQVEIAKALKIDPHSPRAQAAEKRLIQRVNDTAFEDRLAAAEAALEAGRFADAIELFKDAQALRPNHPAIPPLIRRAELALEEQKVAQFVFDAAQAERNCDYQKAFDLYTEALLIQKGRAEAVQGRLRAALGIKNAATAAEFRKTAADRLTLVSIEEVELAVKELQEAVKLVPCDPRAGELLKKAQTALAELNKPVEVTINSDGRTNIDFYKVGQYKPFKTQTLMVKPGTYTIKGWRRGYRDQFLTIEIKPGIVPEPITVTASDKL